MNDEKFQIRAYGKSELAMLYFPHLSKATALRLLRSWLAVNPNLRYLLRNKSKYFTPKQVKQVVSEVGEPFDIQ